jgi:serine/threonine protein kinase
MSLQVGQQLGSYEITFLIGKGGMGEVYRARDSKLKRDVAIKALPDEFANDHDRVMRFNVRLEYQSHLDGGWEANRVSLVTQQNPEFVCKARRWQRHRRATATSNTNETPTAASPDGQVLAFQSTDRRGIWVLPLTGDKKPRLFLDTPFSEGAGTYRSDALTCDPSGFFV